MACAETIIVRCPDRSSENIKRNGKSNIHQQPYYCKRCKRSFQRHYQRKAWTPEVRNLVVAMTMRNSGICDIEDVLDIHRDSVMASIQRAADAIPTAQASNMGILGTAEKAHNGLNDKISISDTSQETQSANHWILKV